MWKSKIFLTMIALLIFYAWPVGGEVQQASKAQPSLSRWVSLSTDSRDTVREIIRSEVDSRELFSSRQEERANFKDVEQEKDRERADYKNAIITATKEFIRSKRKRDDLTSQFHMVSTDLDESAKGIKNIRTTIENLDGQIRRYQKDIKTQQESLKRWLKTEKQGEIVVAVIYTRGFRDRAHTLERNADIVSAPLIAEHMGTYIESFTRMINNVTAVDFIRATEEGTAKWNNEEPIRIELIKDVKGTTYLRLKRYELYPFQESKARAVKRRTPEEFKAAVVMSRKDLDAFLRAQSFNPGRYDLDRAQSIIINAVANNKAAQESLNEQVKTFQDRILILQKKIRTANADREVQRNLLKRKEESYYKLSVDVTQIRAKKEEAERAFVQAQASLHAKKRVHESIIIKTALAATKGYQTPAEASAEVILDKLVEVKNDAKTQHSSSATEVTNYRVTSEAAVQSITEARITAIRLISFINEGDSVRVKMAFRVRTVLDEQASGEEPAKANATPPAQKEPDVQTPSVQTPSAPPAEKTVLPFKRAYRPLASKDALGLLFELRSVTLTKEGLRILVEVINTDKETKKVAFYDYSFPRSWPRSRLVDDKETSHDPDVAYVWQGAQKKTMYELDSRGRGVAVAPQASVTAELVFKNITENVKSVRIHLHPFIYYSSGRRETWQEFDLVMPNMQIRR